MVGLIGRRAVHSDLAAGEVGRQLRNDCRRRQWRK
jgi:hypothetical protein